MFDTMTADAKSREENARAIIAEAARVLRRPMTIGEKAASSFRQLQGGAEEEGDHVTTMVSHRRRHHSSSSRSSSAGGEYLIFSTFRPDDREKSMLQLLERTAEERDQDHSAPAFSIRVEELRECGPPFEIPDQPFPYLYRLGRL